MSSDPYTPPTADLETGAPAIKTSIWTAKGRLGILSYLAHTLVVSLISFALIGVIVAMVVATGESGGSLAEIEPNETLLQILPLIITPILVLSVYLSYCLLIKRLHDRNHVGWWSLLSLIPLLNIFIGIYVMCFPGEKHANRYGGQRTTKGWEKVLAILFIVLMIAAFVGGIVALVLNT